jgi:very-short-patch-repair endonuclease
LLAEKRRQQRLEALGFAVIRWGFDDIVDRPAQTVARVRSALARGIAMRHRSG